MLLVQVAKALLAMFHGRAMAANRRRNLLPIARPSESPLTGYDVVFVGKLAKHNHGILQSVFQSLGASASTIVGRQTTHLVCNEKSYRAKTGKVEKAKRLSHGPRIVKPRWVEEVVKFKQGQGSIRDMNPAKYVWSASSDSPDPNSIKNLKTNKVYRDSVLLRGVVSKRHAMGAQREAAGNTRPRRVNKFRSPPWKEVAEGE